MNAEDDPRIAVESFGKSRLAAEILKAVDAGEIIWLTEKGQEICKIIPLVCQSIDLTRADNDYSVK